MFALVVAVDKDFGIGKNNTIPWRLPVDLKYFATVTTTVQKEGSINAVIMGRKTWESLPEKHRPLKNRLNIVLTHSRDLQVPEGVLIASSLDEALQKVNTVENIFVIGGGKAFEEAINHPACQKIYLTQLTESFNCDTFFPRIDPNLFKLTSKSRPAMENGLEYEFLVYERS